MISLESKVNPHALGFTKVRFWSSGNQLPAIRVIARVLADPVESDLEVLVKQFGINNVLESWKQLQERGEVTESVIPLVNQMLNKLIDE